MLAAVVAAWLLLGAFTPAAWATGTVLSLRGDDLVVTVDTRWAGCAQGGYWPIRFRVVNRGPNRTLTFRFESSNYEHLPSVERTLTAEQNATVEFTLSVPMVGSGGGGRLQVYDAGGEIETLSGRHLALGDVDYTEYERPALVVISPQTVDCQGFEDAVNSLSFATTSTIAHRYSYYGGGSSRSTDHEVLQTSMLPDSWIDYSGLDLVALSLETLDDLPDQNRTAILRWVHQGGALIVYKVGEPAEQSPRLSRLLELDRHDSASPNWQPADLLKRQRVQIVETDEQGNVLGSAVSEVVIGPDGDEQPQAPASATAGFTWPDRDDAFVRRDLMLGQVFAFQDDPFPGSAHDWAWFLNSLGADRFQWTARHGLSARRANDEFLNFLIPGIKGIHVPGFIGLISIFAVVIGPLNYFFCWRRKQLYLLVVTIPVIALATCLALFGYTAVAHGFGTKARVRSVTVLDQKAASAVASSRVSLYAGLAPSRGLRFSPQTAVFTIWPDHDSFEGGRVNWTDRQALQSGFLRSRTRTQFLTVEHRDERGRLEVTPPTGDSMNVTNGLEWTIRAFLVADANGELYYGGELPAGASLSLKKARAEDLQAVVKLLGEHPLAPPPNVSDVSRDGIFGLGGFRYHPYYRQDPVGRFQQNLCERRIRLLSQIAARTAANADDSWEPNSFVAVLKENPGIETGIEQSEEQASLHVLIGYY